MDSTEDPTVHASAEERPYLGAAPAPEPPPSGATADSATAAGLLDQLLKVHIEHDDLVSAADDRRWREGGLALRLVEEFEVSAKTIADQINARAAPAPARKTVSPRWIQRLVEVQRVFSTPESRVPLATWKTHALALDVTRIQHRLSSRQVRTLTSEELSRLSAGSRALVVDALRQEGVDGLDPDLWIGAQRPAAEQEGAQRETDVDPGTEALAETTDPHHGVGFAGASIGDGDGDDDDRFGSADDWKQDETEQTRGTSRPAFRNALASVKALIDDSPTTPELNTLISMLRDARRKVGQS